MQSIFEDYPYVGDVFTIESDNEKIQMLKFMNKIQKPILAFILAFHERFFV